MENILISFYILILSTIIGFEIIRKVPPLLHTPLMSGSNAISGITLVGSIICAGAGYKILATIFGVIAVIFATINVVGGFLVTDRMLKMFKKEGKKMEAKEYK